MATSDKIDDVKTDEIMVSDFNVRKNDKKANIADLAKSIKKYGLLQPIVLTKSNDNKYNYEVIIGQRRFLAHKKLKWKTIKAIIKENLSEIDAKVLSLAENMQRVDLNITDKMEAITYLFNKLGKNVKNVADTIKCSQGTVREYIKLEAIISDFAKQLLDEKKISRIDVKRAYNASQGDLVKMDKILNEMPNLTKYAKERAEDHGKKNKDATADEIIEEARQPRQKEVLILNLSEDIDKALKKAEKKLSIDKESIAANALSTWLKDNNFLR